MTGVTLLGLPADIATQQRFLIVDTQTAAIQAASLLPSYAVLWPSVDGAIDQLSLEAWLPLNGCEVLLWPSNIPATRKAMATAANSLARVTDRLRMIYVNGGEPAFFNAADCADWNTAKLVAWAKERTRPYEREVVPDPMAELQEIENDRDRETDRDRADPDEAAWMESQTDAADGAYLRGGEGKYSKNNCSTNGQQSTDRQYKREETNVTTEEPLHFNDTDRANARRLAQRHGIDSRYAVEGKWLIWDGKRWSLDHKAIDIQRLAKSTSDSIYDDIKLAENQKAMFAHAKKSQSKASIEAMISLARSEPGIKCSLSAFDTHHWLLNVANGTLDLRSGELHPHNRADLITRIAPVEYYPEAECELWDAFINYILNYDSELYAYIKRLIGYLLTGQVTEQVLHFLYGMGANGKSVFCEVLAALLGEYAIIISPELLMQKRHGGGIPNDVARLRGARLALMNETSQGARFDEAKLKDLTGSDSLNARFLHAEFFDFKPTHKLIIRGNHKPSISGTDEGIWRRLRLVPFAVQVPDDQQDKMLLSKLCAELPGILRWAVAGCLEWQRDGLNPPKTIMDAVKEYREESDTLGRFINECCTTSDKTDMVKKQVKSSVFFKRYQEFAEQSGDRWTSAKELPHEMARRGFRWEKSRLGNIFHGIEISANERVGQRDWNDQD